MSLDFDTHTQKIVPSHQHLFIGQGAPSGRPVTGCSGWLCRSEGRRLKSLGQQSDSIAGPQARPLTPGAEAMSVLDKNVC